MLESLPTVLPRLLQALPATLIYWFVPSVLELLLGTLLCIARVGRKGVTYWVCTVVISFFRGTPGIVQLYLVFFGLPKLFALIGADIEDWQAGAFFIIATTLNLSCFVCEALRGGYLAVDRGQIETGLSLGYNRWQNFVHVIAPQTLRVSLLNLKNLEIAVMKDTSIAYVIGAACILGTAKTIISARYGVGQLAILGIAGVCYFVLCAVLEAAFGAASHRLARHERKVVA